MESFKDSLSPWYWQEKSFFKNLGCFCHNADLKLEFEAGLRLASIDFVDGLYPENYMGLCAAKSGLPANLKLKFSGLNASKSIQASLSHA